VIRRAAAFIYSDISWDFARKEEGSQHELQGGFKWDLYNRAEACRVCCASLG